MLHYLVLLVILAVTFVAGVVYERRKPGRSLLGALDPALAYLQGELERARKEAALNGRLAEFQDVMAKRSPAPATPSVSPASSPAAVTATAS